jgi:ATP-dependent exoDNAse (exonuclease V) beta subunit (contains helicase and exonuclease domains)
MTKWNESQQEVLESLNNDSNVLVAAAAGSGKTAVLVERIIRSITEGRCNIDELLVVTFMKDAAAQMKAKIISALEKLCADGGNSALIKQLAIADRADITTIDSFSGRVVRDNFSVLGIDPAYDMYDTAEAKMIHEDVMEECFEKWYNSDPEFIKLAKLFIQRGFDDSVLRSIILKIYTVSQSYANEKGFYEKLREEASTGSEGFDDVTWVQSALEETFLKIDSVRENLTILKDYFMSFYETELSDSAEKVVVMIDSDIDYIDCAKRLKTIESILNYAETSLQRFGNKKKMVEVFGEPVDIYDTQRKSIRTILKKLPDLTELAEEVTTNKDITISLVDYTEKFSEKLISEKIKNRKYEFGDIAHFAYKVLHNEETGEISAVAERLRDQYKYIYIDEYQDSNDLQEEILNSIARRDEEGYPYNIFMVGDVKQSIYRFRLAKPKLFMDKFDNYKDKKIPGRLINLNMNYRSRREILEGTNFIFRGLMHREVGRIEYDADAELKTPEEEDYLVNFPVADECLNVGGLPEIIAIREYDEVEEDECTDEDDNNNADVNVDKDADVDGKNIDNLNSEMKTYDTDETPDSEEEDEDDNLTGTEDYISREEIEAEVIADKILEIVNGDEEKGICPVYIKNEHYDSSLPESDTNQRYRKAEYGDITILMSVVAGAEEMVDVFERRGISARLDNNKGYFDAAEIITMVSILNVIDNARIDIPYVSVLLSHIGGLTEPETALIVTRRPKRRRYMYDMCFDFQNAYIDSDDKKLRDISLKLKKVNDLIAKWKEIKSYLTIAELIDMILADTEYDLFVSSMPQGKVRLSNLRMLRYKAECFEKTGFTSLFDFLRYIDKCKIHEEGFGDSGASHDGRNAVSITSIHKSKGLEYPIVILARTGKSFNRKEYTGPVIVDPEQGAAHDVYKVKENGICIKKKGIKKDCLIKELIKEDNAEFMRLLYVGMTRAKEKLIITGMLRRPYDRMGYSTAEILSMGCFMDMIIPSANLQEFEKYFKFSKIGKNDILKKAFGTESRKQLRDKSEIYELLEKGIEKESDSIAENKEAQNNPYKTEYKYRAALTEKSKTAVTKIEKDYIEKISDRKSKNQTNETRNELENELKNESNDESTDELKNEVRTEADDSARRKAARRGTVVHKIMELLDYSKVNSKEDMDQEIDRILKRNFFTDEDRKELNRKMVLGFYSDDESSLFRRMKKASESGYLFREKSFFMGMKPYEIPGSDYTEQDFGDDSVTVQGTIDAFFYEKDDDGKLSITLVDYKTDRVRRGQELIDRYSVQLYLYSISLSMITDAKINGIIFYCFALNEEVDCSEAVEQFKSKIK